MAAGPNGFTPTGRLVEEIGSWISRRAQLGGNEFRVECIEPLIDSAAAAPITWFDLADRLWRAQDLVDGVVILHGTDTLAYTSSALSFLMAGFDRPIVLTGAQIPFSQPGSDGEANTIGAIACALDPRIREVCVFFGARLMRGNRVRKWSTDSADGFLSPHWPVLATFNGRLNVETAALLDGGVSCRGGSGASRWTRAGAVRPGNGRLLEACASRGFGAHYLRWNSGSGRFPMFQRNSRFRFLRRKSYPRRAGCHRRPRSDERGGFDEAHLSSKRRHLARQDRR